MKINYRKVSKELLKIATPVDESIIPRRSSVNTAIDVVEHYRIEIERLIPYRNQARKNISEEEILGLSKSIKEQGLRQPLTVIQSSVDETKYEVVSGERRLRAASLAGLSKIPCIIISDQKTAEEIALVENIQRQDLHPIEMGDAFRRIIETRENENQVSLAEKLGVSNKLVSESIQYTKLPPEVKEVVLSRNITGRDFLRKLTKSSNPIELLESYKKPQNTSRPNSILRISLEGRNFHIQSEAINKLDTEMRCELKYLLSNLIDSIVP